jgi:hypothetical protein
MRQAQPSFYWFGSDRLYLGGAALVLLSYVLEAPLRFGLSALSLHSLIYLRDAWVLLTAALITLSWLRGQVSATLFVGVSCVLGVHTLIGVLNCPAIAQPLFGFKQFLPLLLGLSIAPLLQARVRQVSIFAGVCFGLTALGVLLNVWVDYPWIGMSYETAAGTMEVSKQWWSDAGLRLPGFTRASYLAAQLMPLCLVPLLSQRLGRIVRLGLYASAAAIIWLTTTKGALTGVLALALSDVCLSLPGWSPLLGVLLAGEFATCLALPLIAVQIGPLAAPVPGWAQSLMERIGDMWPRAFELYDGALSVVFGRGLGGIGMSQNFGESFRFNAADNLMVFLLVTFGLLGPIYLGIVVARLAAFCKHLPIEPVTRWAAGWIVILLAIGLTTGMLEDPVTSVSLGISLGLLARSPQPWAAELLVGVGPLAPEFPR